MADIFAFPTDATADGIAETAYDRFLLDECLELLSDFRSIEDRQIRDSVRTLVKSMAHAAGKATREHG